ncbi:MAG: 3TM-type holin [Pseudomonadota bacterium]
MLPYLAPAALKIGAQLIDKLFESDREKAKAKAKLIEVANKGELKQTEQQLSAILAEAKSNDKWTSRARPAFLYVVYIMILSAIPMGILFAFKPDTAINLIEGVKLWLSAIPDPLWALFGAGYLGYTGARSFDKKKILKQ